MRWCSQLTCVLGLACLVGGCSGGEKDGRAAVARKPVPAVETPADSGETVARADTVATDTPPSPAPVASAEPQPAAASDAEPAPAPKTETAPAPQPVPTVPPQPEPEPKPAPTPQPEPEPQAPAVPATPPAAADELAGQVVAVPATKDGLTPVGAAKCKTCHKVQYESWAASAHAERVPPLDCEGCHGPGSEYKKLATMKDPALAAAAGLVMPAKTFCTTTCHRTNWQDDMLARSHAHKAKTP